MEQPPALETDIAPIVERAVAEEEEAQKFIEGVVHAADFEQKRKPVETALRELLGKSVKVVDFRHMEGKRYEFLLEVGEDGEEQRQVVELSE